MKSYMAVSFFALVVGPAYADGVLDFADPCKKQESEFSSTTKAIKSSADATVEKFAAWNANPDTLPPDVFEYYRQAVRQAVFHQWRETPSGKGTILSWQLTDAEAIETKFFNFVYSSIVSSADEKKLANTLYQQDYAQNIKPKLDVQMRELHNQVASQKSELDKACSPAVFNQIMRATIGNAVIMATGNFNAAKDEHGVIAKAFRATSGISLTDIARYGVLGGPNSEANKLHNLYKKALDSAGLGESTVVGQVLSVADPANLRLPEIKIPSHIDTTVRIDSGTAKNVCRNVTFGIACH